MKNFFLFLLALIAVFQTNAQIQTLENDTCLPVPWVVAEIIDEDHILIQWDVPCDTCNVTSYQLGLITDFDPCCDIYDGMLEVLGNTLSLQWIYEVDRGFDYRAFWVRAKYNYGTSQTTSSNVVFYDTPYFDTAYSLQTIVSLEDGGNPEGALVIPAGANCYYEGLGYEDQANSDGLTLFEEVERGTYNVTISKPGYHTEVIEDFCIDKDSTINVELKVFYVGEEEKYLENHINIYPNPASGQLNISSSIEVHQIDLINLLGQTVFQQEVNTKDLTIDISKFEKGIYILKIETDQGFVNKRVVIGD